MRWLQPRTVLGATKKVPDAAVAMAVLVEGAEPEGAAEALQPTRGGTN